MSLFDFARAFGALLFTLGLLLGFAWLVKKYSPFNGAIGGEKGVKRLKIIEQLWIDGGKNRLAIISIDNHEEVFLIGTNGASHVTLSANGAKTAPNIKEITDAPTT